MVIKVENVLDDNMLPRGHSSDWAPDGGIYRPVSLLFTPKVYVERVDVDADPDPGTRTAVLEIAVFMSLRSDFTPRRKNSIPAAFAPTPRILCRRRLVRTLVADGFYRM
jgi:hypothetical protein